MPSTAFFIGRFQPLHLGHSDAVEQILKDKPNRIILGIGSSESELTFKNPLSFYERKEILETFLTDVYNLQNQRIQHQGRFIEILIQPIPDFGNPEKWTNYILQELPNFDCLYTGNSYTQACFEKTDKTIKILETNQFIKAITIRRLILEDLNWQKLVPKAVAKKLQELKIKDRIKEIYKFEEELNQANFLKNNQDLKPLEVDLVLVEKQTDWEFLQEHGLPNLKYLTKVQKLKKWHNLHQQTRQEWIDFLTQNQISYKTLKAFQVDEFNFDKVKILVSLGGDGTFLATAKQAKNQPIIGINSQPNKSVGKLTPFTPQDCQKLFSWILKHSSLTPSKGSKSMILGVSSKGSDEHINTEELKGRFDSEEQQKIPTSADQQKICQRGVIPPLERGLGGVSGGLGGVSVPPLKEANTPNLKIKTFDRLGVKINQKETPSLAVNEIYIGQPIVYKSSKVKLELENKGQAKFFSNGLIVSTYQGSTAFYCSSKGKKFTENQFAYISLLTFKTEGELPENLILEKTEKLIITPERAGHSLVFDGDEKREIKLKQGDRVEVFIHSGSELRQLTKINNNG